MNPDNQNIDFCCRDPNYKDPWPNQQGGNNGNFNNGNNFGNNNLGGGGGNFNNGGGNQFRQPNNNQVRDSIGETFSWPKHIQHALNFRAMAATSAATASPSRTPESTVAAAHTESNGQEN